MYCTGSSDLWVPSSCYLGRFLDHNFNFDKPINHIRCRRQHFQHPVRLRPSGESPLQGQRTSNDGSFVLRWDLLSANSMERHPSLQLAARGTFVPLCTHQQFRQHLCHSTIIPPHTRWLKFSQDSARVCLPLTVWAVWFACGLFIPLGQCREAVTERCMRHTYCQSMH